MSERQTLYGEMCANGTKTVEIIWIIVAKDGPLAICVWVSKDI